MKKPSRTNTIVCLGDPWRQCPLRNEAPSIGYLFHFVKFSIAWISGRKETNINKLARSKGWVLKLGWMQNRGIVSAINHML